MSESEDIINGRRSKTGHETDKLGRVIGVRLLRPSQETRAIAMTVDLDGDMSVPDPNRPGEVFKIPIRAGYMIAAQVCEINGVPVPFARNRNELDAIFDRLDQEGLEAAAIGIAKIRQEIESEQGLDAAKNSAGTQFSDSNSGS
jgi:hypothetical protein